MGRDGSLPERRREISALFLRECTMSGKERELSVFVDESGSFDNAFVPSRFYIVTCVFHDQSIDLSPQLAALETRLEYLESPGICLHTGPIIRREAEFAAMPLVLRRKLLSQFLVFATHAPIRYHAACVDKRFISSTESIVKSLTRQLSDFVSANSARLAKFSKIKVYYDNGQRNVRQLLLSAFGGMPVEFPPNVTPGRYRLFQVADLVSSIELIKAKLAAGEPLTKSEMLFFRNTGTLRKNYIRPLSKLLIRPIAS